MRARLPISARQTKAAHAVQENTKTDHHVVAWPPPSFGMTFVDRAQQLSPAMQFRREDGVEALVQMHPQPSADPGIPPASYVTALPSQLKAGIEALSGHDLSDVRVFANSHQPAELSAHAYAQGNEIHLGPGKERHLPHEAWHVVQQRQGRVQPTSQLAGGTPINDQVELEREAEAMGAQAPRKRADLPSREPHPLGPNSATAAEAREPAANPTTLVIQGVWSDLPLDHARMKHEKKLGRIRTSKIKFNSIKDWVKKFLNALRKDASADAFDALVGLRKRLESDAQDAAAGRLKAPKKTKKSDFNLAEVQGAATDFFKRWIDATDAHLVHAKETENWMADYRALYLGTTSSDKLEEVEDKGVASNPRSLFLESVAELEEIGAEDLEGMKCLWDLGNEAQRQIITEVMGGDEELKRVGGLTYFIEAISPIHVGYERAKAIFRLWVTGVLYHNVTKPYAEWMQERVQPEDKVITYYSDEQRAQYALTLAGKQVLKADGKALVGDNIYALSGDDVFYGGPNGSGVHHTSFLAGRPVKCAGHLHTDSSGHLKVIDNSSGHYAPSRANLKRAALVLKARMDTSEVMVGNYGHGGVPLDKFLKSK